MESHEVECWTDYLWFLTTKLGYGLSNETVLDASPPVWAFKSCERNCWNRVRLGVVTDDPQVLQLRAMKAEEQDCGHPPRKNRD